MTTDELRHFGETPRMVLKSVLEPMGNGRTFVWAFEKGGEGRKVAGFSLDTQRQGLLNINLIIVYDAFRRRGFGREIYEFLGDHAQSLGRRFVPSETLTEDSERIWRHRDFPLEVMSEEFQRNWRDKWSQAQTCMVGKGLERAERDGKDNDTATHPQISASR